MRRQLGECTCDKPLKEDDGRYVWAKDYGLYTRVAPACENYKPKSGHVRTHRCGSCIYWKATEQWEE